MTTTATATTKRTPFDPARVRPLLRQFKLGPLFKDELGWDRCTEHLRIEVDDQLFTLDTVAQKREIPIFACAPTADGSLPERRIRQRIERAVAKTHHQHLIVFTDAAHANQIWQWVRREPGKSDIYREERYQAGLHEQALIEKLNEIKFGLDEEDDVTHTDVNVRATKAFDVDRVTRRFYDRFKDEHKRFLQDISGIAGDADRAWYASVMLNRLMFVYFIQKKGFLDGDTHYLRNRLRRVQDEQGTGHFHSFYRAFLLRLFHEGLGAPKPHGAALVALIGNVPYLNGGIFDHHKLEQDYDGIEIPDETFERIFEFFEAYQWRLDDRPLRADNEINPDVLGYIFEKYINQKEMGAYYTKEDITEYIAKSTIIPFLFNVAERKCRIAFEGEPSVWDLLRENPDRYVYDAIKKGADLPLPEEIAAGLSDVSKRGGWNRSAPDEYALPTEIWREVVARRKRYQEVRAKLEAGEVRAINDLITYNLDLRRFALDVIQYSEGPELLRAFYQAIERVTVLDPTCGSGAFLFAALNILEPLYEICLERMAGFVDEAERLGKSTDKGHLGSFNEILAQVANHPNRRYFILKTIVVNNLYGVDIMEEAVEICKLRLFLKLVAQVEGVAQIEPLPDIDFNIRAGNTLVGFTSLEEVKRTIAVDHRGNARLPLPEDAEALRRIEEQAASADRAFREFRRQQTMHGGSITIQDKIALRTRLEGLSDELDEYLGRQFGLFPESVADERKHEREFDSWRKSHLPFHWFAEFHEIMERGGFAVIIGNPPWLEYSRVKKEYTVRGYQTLSCGNLYGMCIERSRSLRSNAGGLSFIVQLPLTNSSRMGTVRTLLKLASDSLWIATFDDRPAKLFEGLEHCRATIFNSRGRGGAQNGSSLYTTGYQRWSSASRSCLLSRLAYTRIGEPPIFDDHFPKYASSEEVSVFGKIGNIGNAHLGSAANQRRPEWFVFYQEATQYWVKTTIGLPHYVKNGVIGAPAHGRYIYANDSAQAQAIGALLSSSLFYSYFVAYGDCFHLTDGLVSTFPVPDDLVRSPTLIQLGADLADNLSKNAGEVTITTRAKDRITYAEYYGALSKPIIDEIDRVLAEHYGFTDEELDFIINYDIKYRMGRDSNGEEE